MTNIFQPDRPTVRRLVTPIALAALAALTAVMTDWLMTEILGWETLGPLLPGEVALFGTIAWLVLAVTALVLAFVPDSGGSEVHSFGCGPEGAPERPDRRFSVAGLAKRSPERSPDEVIVALTDAATVEAQRRATAEAEASRALDKLEHLQQQVDGFRTGASAEARALRAQYRDEATRDAESKIDELGGAAERLGQALREAKDRAEVEVAELLSRSTAELAEERALSAARLSERDIRLRSLTEALRVARSEAAEEEFRRIRAALEEVITAEVEAAEDGQYDVAARFQERLNRLLDRLCPSCPDSAVGTSVTTLALSQGDGGNLQSRVPRAGRGSRRGLLRRGSANRP